jgi:hypothetical protein
MAFFMSTLFSSQIYESLPQHDFKNKFRKQLMAKVKKGQCQDISYRWYSSHKIERVFDMPITPKYSHAWGPAENRILTWGGGGGTGVRYGTG